MNAGGSPRTGNGSGNGTPPRPTNGVKLSQLYREQRDAFKERHPRLVQDQLFEQFEAFMVIVDLEEDAVSHLGGVTYQMRTPDDYPLYVTFYFTYAARQIVMRAVHVDA